MDNKRVFVQFIHPGGEHGDDGNGVKEWNTGLHQRKFLTSPGRYIDDGVERSDELVFWGEWEAQSRIVKRYSGNVQGGPGYLHAPYYELPTSWEGVWIQNTDPFVFGDQFHYTGCLQHTKRGPTFLRFLVPGSIVLFGSCREKNRFVLDTLFVTDHHCLEHTRLDYTNLKGKVSETYYEVTMLPWYLGDVPANWSHRLYFGATPRQPVDDLYSFFPCRPASEASDGFPRPTIQLDGLITPTLIQGKKRTVIASTDGARELWAQVADQVKAQGLKLGVHAALPPRLGSVAMAQRSAGSC